MTGSQSIILETLRAQLGDQAADQVAEGWARDGIDRPRDDKLTRGELARLMEWRVSSNVHRRQVAIARLARYGYTVELNRVRADRAAALRHLSSDPPAERPADLEGGTA